MLVLVTRPREQAAATVAALEALGHAALVDPVLEIVPLSPPDPGPGGVAAVVLTSANAARLLPASLRSLPAFAVGRATAEAARAAGCADVRAGEDDGRALAALIARELPAAAGALLHAGAAEVRPGLAEALRASGHDYRHLPIYRVEPSGRLGDEAASALRAGTVGAALFFSPRTAAAWRRRAEAAGLADRLGGIVAACISRPVAAELDGLPWRELRVAPRRDQAALLGCLDGPGRRW